jgi:hypothetical protein
MKKDLHDPIEFLSAIHMAGVRYLLIGRQAVIAYGGPVQAMDFAVMVDGGEENVKKLVQIAEAFALHPTVSEERIGRVYRFRLENDIFIDVFRAKSYANQEGERMTFDALYRRRVVIKDPKGLELNVPSIDDLIALKKIRRDERDRADIRYLQRIRKNGMI